jgi:glycosyltransferase involved in cell wall biosynthesis
MLLSVVIPVYHGSVTIQKLVESAQEQLKEYSFEIILINDGSKDDSEKKCLELSEKFNNVSFLSLRKNFGEFQAVMCGLNHAKGDYTVIIDDDFQNPPSEIIKLLETAQQGNFDVVYGQYEEKKHHQSNNDFPF